MKLSPRRMCSHYKKIMDRPDKFKGEVKTPDIRMEDYQVPSKRIVWRHMLKEFGHTPFIEGCLVPEEVSIPLCQHIGAPARAVVKKGQKVKRGECIGYVGTTGTSTAPHLHYEVHKDNRKINPVHYFSQDLNPAEYEEILRLSSIENQALGSY